MKDDGFVDFSVYGLLEGRRVFIRVGCISAIVDMGHYCEVWLNGERVPVKHDIDSVVQMIQAGVANA